MAGVREHGPCQNAAFFARHLSMHPLLPKLFVSKVNSYPFTEHWDDNTVTMAYMAYFGAALTNNGGMPDEQIVYAAVMGELVSAHLPNDLMMEQNAARAKFVTAVNALITYPKLSTITRNTIEGFTAAVQVGQATYRDEALVAQFGEFLPADTQLGDFASGIRILYHLAQAATPAFQKDVLSLIAMIIIAIVKRGIVSILKSKMENNISNDLGKPVHLLPEAIRMYYRGCGAYINDNNIQELITDCMGLIPAYAVRLMATVTKMAGTGLTSYITIGKALLTYPTFNWENIVAMYPHEWEGYRAAVNLVGGNLYFGYRRDLGIAKATNYRSIAYVAKELLIKIGGQVTLRRYKGWSTRVAYQIEVDRLIDNFSQAQGRAVAVNENSVEELDEAVAALRKIVIANAESFA